MSESLLNNKTKNGFEVSTIRTDSGGAPPSTALFGWISSADYDDLNSWPFETMVFKIGTRKGLYHQPYADEETARTGHARILEAVERGSLEFGTTVTGEQGLPLITPGEWQAQQEASKNERTNQS